MIKSLERFATALPAVVKDVSAQDARWKPAPDQWSILEIVCHLADEEVDDFRKRVHMTLENPTQDWPPIDPPGWAVQRKYNEGNLESALSRFDKERSDSLKWLNTLNEVDWSVAHVHPKIGPIRAGDLLVAWAAHDALHLRQISRRMFQLVERDAGQFITRYAGEW